MKIVHIFAYINFHFTNVSEIQISGNNEFTSFFKYVEIMNEFSFQKGWSQVRRKDVAIVRTKLMEELNITTRMAFLDRLNGKVEPKISEYRAIENVFKMYGINEIWGAA